MCDLCIEGTGDHDREYAFGDWVAFNARFTSQEIKVLDALRAHVFDVRGGYSNGRAFGDLSNDDPVCAICGHQCSEHTPVGLCG